ncbi:hypothetical protein [Cellulomonas sp.]|uniref:hypothetical protein n=1 Tax=Cellulomonas sp. TaxID=40001 RepID=UPI003BA8CA86
MHEFVLNPPTSAGVIEIGMPIEDAERRLRLVEGFVPPEPGTRRDRGFAYYESGFSITAAPDDSGRVSYVEFSKAFGVVAVLYDGISIFDEPTEEIIRLLATRTRVTIEDFGFTVVAPDLLLSLGRNSLPSFVGDPGGGHFDSVLMSAPGLYG